MQSVSTDSGATLAAFATCRAFATAASRGGAETGSMTGWWVTSLSPTTSTTQSPQTACFQHYAESRVSAGDFRPLISQILVSVGVHASRGQFWVPCLRIQKFRSRRPASAARRLSYSGLSPSASNCRLHSVGGSRRRSMPMPRGSRPSTAALTSLGARKANEMTILTFRTLHFSRVQSCATVVTRPETTSSSHRRPRAIALTKRARRSNCSGRTSLRDALCGSRIWRDLLEGGMPENRERRIIRGVGRLVRAIRFEPNDKRVLVHNNPGDQLCEGAAIA
jgi:hypothetical protein